MILKTFILHNQVTVSGDWQVHPSVNVAYSLSHWLAQNMPVCMLESSLVIKVVTLSDRLLFCPTLKLPSFAICTVQRNIS